MAKLYPPLIEGAIPAFYKINENGIDKIKITIPFSMNRAVSPAQVGGFALKVKTVQSTTYLFEMQTTDANTWDLNNNFTVTFTIIDKVSQFSKKEGQSFKFQLAYIEKGTKEIGYYSTVGVGKYTTYPQIYLQDLNIEDINSHRREYMGVYSQEQGDKTERVYSSCFNFYDVGGKLLFTSGEKLHNSQNDIELYESYDIFSLAEELKIDKIYYLEYCVTTINGMKATSQRYRIVQRASIEPDIKTDVKAVLNYENGYIDINLVGHLDEWGMETPVTGAFLLTRASEDTDYQVWDEISRFKLQAQIPSRWLWRDYTVEQGKKYQYAIQQYNDYGLYSNKIYSNVIYADFEYAFLFDGVRQLKIKYNPKVTTFKADILETKIDTIGSKHPFIFRNGNVNYREFPISGLISYLMDEEYLFMDKDDYLLKETTTNLISSNLTSERIFKLEVLNWLTNGEVKLFRSPTEGNYIVRLMNSSLTPNDTLGRMLHTFNCTAYEIAEFNYENLNSYNFIHLKDPKVATLRFETVFFKDILANYNEGSDYIQINPAGIKMTTLRVIDLMPGDTLKVTFVDGKNQTIVIGVTGSYYLDLGMEITKLEIPTNLFQKKDENIIPLRPNASVTYSYYSISQNLYDKISNVQVSELPMVQYIGAHDVIKDIEYILDTDSKTYLKNPKVGIIQFYHLSASKRPVQKAKEKQVGNKIQYLSPDGKSNILEPDIFSIYSIGDYETVEYKPGYFTKKWITTHYRDPAQNNKYINLKDYEAAIYVGDAKIVLEDNNDFEAWKMGKIDNLIVGNGAILNVSYQIRIIDYLIESSEQWNVMVAKEEYINAVTELNNYLNDDKDLTEEVEKRDKVNKAYTKFIKILIENQEAEKVAEGRE